MCVFAYLSVKLSQEQCDWASATVCVSAVPLDDGIQGPDRQSHQSHTHTHTRALNDRQPALLRSSTKRRDRACRRTCDPVKTPKKRPLNLSPKQLDLHFLVFCFVFSPRSDEWTVTDCAQNRGLAYHSSQLEFLAVFQNIFQSEFKRKISRNILHKKKRPYSTMQCTSSVSKLKISIYWTVRKLDAKNKYKCK